MCVFFKTQSDLHLGAQTRKKVTAQGIECLNLTALRIRLHNLAGTFNAFYTTHSL
jgi:hypothetical protein